MQHFQLVSQANPEWFKGTRIIYDAEALFTSREIALQKLKGTEMSKWKIHQLIKSEAELARTAGLVISVSRSEGDILTRYGIPNVQVLGHAISAVPTERSFEDREGFLFVGCILEENSPNGDAAIWFARDILPKIREELGPVPFTIAGINRLDAMLAGSNIRVLGKVKDLSTAYDQSRVFVAPTRYSAGIPHKIHEAAAKGLPVVTTSLLAQQLGWSNGVHILVADNPKDFARHCITLYRHPEVWERIRRGALEQVQMECSPLAFKTGLRSIVSEKLA
jgi:glycosyltransferase involved in cell wall biosynthesis